MEIKKTKFVNYQAKYNKICGEIAQKIQYGQANEPKYYYLNHRNKNLILQILNLTQSRTTHTAMYAEADWLVVIDQKTHGEKTDNSNIQEKWLCTNKSP